MVAITSAEGEEPLLDAHNFLHSDDAQPLIVADAAGEADGEAAPDQGSLKKGGSLAAALPYHQYFPRRYLFVGIAFLGTSATYMLRSNLSAAIIPMAAQFGWSKTEQGTVLSAFFIGYVLANLPGSLAALRFGPARVFLWGTCITALLTLLTPWVATQGGVTAAVALRIAQGASEGGMYPALHMAISQWALPEERSFMASWIYSGNYMGTALGLGFTGLQLSGNGGSPAWAWARIGGGSSCWPAAFYVQGLAVLLWAALWGACVYDSPAVHPSIAPAERKLIEGARPPAPPPTLQSIRDIPWLRILLNVPFLAIVCNHFVTNCCNYILMSWSTTYIKEQLHRPVDSAGVLGLLPYLTAWAVALVAGVGADFLIRTGRKSVSWVRRVWQCTSLLTCAVLLTGLGYITDSNAALAVLCCAVGALGGTESGYHGNHLDLFPTHAGIAFAITNVVGNMGGVVGPALVGRILDTGSNAENPSVAQWRTVFFACAATNLLGVVVWGLFSSGKRQL